MTDTTHDALADEWARQRRRRKLALAATLLVLFVAAQAALVLSGYLAGLLAGLAS